MGRTYRANDRNCHGRLDKLATRSSCVCSPIAVIVSSLRIVRWDPQRKDLVHYKQSVLLRAQYYVLQLSIRRPFIRPGRNSQLSEKSLLMSTKAARDCCNLVYTARERLGLTMRMCSVSQLHHSVVFLADEMIRKRHSSLRYFFSSTYGRARPRTIPRRSSIVSRF